MGLASLLVAFTGGVYYVSMNKLKQARGTRARWGFRLLLLTVFAPAYAQTDDLSELEGKVNAHQSGLKLDRADIAPPAAAASFASEKPKQTGWRRVVFFWR